MRSDLLVWTRPLGLLIGVSYLARLSAGPSEAMFEC